MKLQLNTCPDPCPAAAASPVALELQTGHSSRYAIALHASAEWLAQWRAAWGRRFKFDDAGRLAFSSGDVAPFDALSLCLMAVWTHQGLARRGGTC